MKFLYFDNHDVSLQAAYISIGTVAKARNSVTTTPLLGAGEVSLNASFIDVIGDVDITNTGRLALNAAQDVRILEVPILG